LRAAGVADLLSTKLSTNGAPIGLNLYGSAVRSADDFNRRGGRLRVW